MPKTCIGPGGTCPVPWNRVEPFGWYGLVPCPVHAPEVEDDPIGQAADIDGVLEAHGIETTEDFLAKYPDFRCDPPDTYPDW